MKLDVVSLVLITSLVFTTNLIGVVLQYNVNKSYRGLNWWLVGVILFALGFLLMPMVLFPPLRILAVFANPSVILGLFFLGLGIDDFFGRKRPLWLVVLLPTLGIALYGLFILLPGGQRGRFVVVPAVTSVIALKIAYALFRERQAKFRASICFSAVVFSVYGLFQAGMAVYNLQVSSFPDYGSLADSPVLAIMYLVPIVCGPLWSFGYIIMMNQRLNTANRELVEQLAREKTLAEISAVTDSLTGLMNRRFFDESLKIEFFRMKRSGTPLSLIMLDVDHFKLFNDTYGHQAGDACLRRVGSALRFAVRQQTDVAARYGGEEFAVILPNTDPPRAAEIAERIRLDVEEMAIPHDTSPTAQCLTVSLGVVTLHGEGPQGPDEAVARADAALYEAKRSGRNRVIVVRE